MDFSNFLAFVTEQCNIMNLVKSESGIFVQKDLIKSNKRKKHPLVTSQQISDRYVNNSSGFGAHGIDPQTNTWFEPDAKLDQATLDAMHEGSWLAKRVVELVPKLATKKGFIINAEKKENEEKATKIHRRMKGWNSERKLFKHAVQANLSGAAAKIFYLEDDYPMNYPLLPNSIRDIECIEIVDSFSAFPQHFYPNPRDRKRFGKPMLWNTHIYKSAWIVTNEQIHDQRMSWIEGNYLTPRSKAKNRGFGDSVLQCLHETLRAHETSIQSVGSIIQDFVLKVAKISNLEELLDDEEGRKELDERMLQMDQQSSMHDTIAVGDNEDFKKIATPISGLVELVIILMDQVSAASGIPKSVLFGNLTGTLGSSSGDSDHKNLCSIVEEYQEKELTKSLMFEFNLACHLEAADPLDYSINWLNIRDQGEKEIAETNKRKSETLKVSTEIAEKWNDASIKEIALEVNKLIEQRVA
ncbi:MAG: phage-related protein (TIGR01555 family) [bacterium]|jgi:phage-related protein (TIGR01555 family)